MLQLNQDLSIELLDAGPALADVASPAAPPGEPAGAGRETIPPAASPHARGMCWYLAGGCLLVIALLLVAFTFAGTHVARPINLTLMNHSQCELLASDEMLRSVSATAYGKNFDEVRQRLKLSCKPGERFVFFYGDRLETNGLGRVFLAHCAMHEDNPFSYCDNYFYYSWKPQ